METKYYIPTIDEFHVGFEYERLLNESGYDSYWKFDILKNNWSKRVFTQSDFDKGRGWDNRRDLEDGYIRVKYLDKEDIESLGFEEIGQEDYYLNGDLNNWRIERLYDKDKNYFYRVEKEDRADLEQIFFVYIKNKSELKKLLVQLGIR